MYISPIFISSTYLEAVSEMNTQWRHKGRIWVQVYVLCKALIMSVWLYAHIVLHKTNLFSSFFLMDFIEDIWFKVIILIIDSNNYKLHWSWYIGSISDHTQNMIIRKFKLLENMYNQNKVKKVNKIKFSSN